MKVGLLCCVWSTHKLYLCNSKLDIPSSKENFSDMTVKAWSLIQKQTKCFLLNLHYSYQELIIFFIKILLKLINILQISQENVWVSFNKIYYILSYYCFLIARVWVNPGSFSEKSVVYLNYEWVLTCLTASIIVL